MVRVAIIIGSVRKGRQTHKIAHYIKERFEEKDSIEIRILDLLDYNLPILEDEDEIDSASRESIRSLGEELKRSDSVILISPEYHGSFTGVLKNALDYYWKEFSQKPIGIATVSTGKHGGINASSQMQLLALSLGGYALPYKLIIPYADKAFDENNKPALPEIEKNTEKFMKDFLWFSNAIVNAKNGVMNE